MNIDELYSYARRTALSFQTRDYEDVVQDAVFYTWQTMNRKKHLRPGYIKKRIYLYVLNAIKRYSRQQKNEPDENICVACEDYLIELPLRRVNESGEIIRHGLTERQREVTETLIKNDYIQRLAAEELGISQQTFSSHWQNAKKALRNFYMEEEQCT